MYSAGSATGSHPGTRPYTPSPMSPRSVPPLVYLGVFLVSGAALGLEIVLTRILALMMWHHFTYVVIGVALLGFGAAGSYATVRAIARRGDEESPGRLLSRYGLYFAATGPLCYVMLTRVRIAPLAIADEPAHAIALLLIYLLIVIPFFFGGLVICEAIRLYSERVGSVYFVDLAGAGVGAAAAVLLLEPLTGPGVVVVLGAVAAVAAVCFAVSTGADARHPGNLVKVAMCLGLATWLVVAALPAAKSRALDPPLAPSKELTALPAHMKLSDTVWSPLARIDISAELRVKPAMGGAFPPYTPPRDMRLVFQDGSAPTLFLKWNGESDAGLDFLRDASASAGHVALQARGVENVRQMAIGVGGGIDLLIGTLFGVERVTGVEINGAMLAALEGKHAEYGGSLTRRDDVEVVNAEGRHFARASGRKFHLIQLSGVDTYTALSSGAYTLSESYLYTTEALEELLEALEPDGLLSYSRVAFLDNPRETLRLALTAVEVLEGTGVESPADHIFVFERYNWASLIVSRVPLEPAVMQALRDLASRGDYRVAFDPEHDRGTAWDAGLRATPEAREAFYDEYPFDVRPAPDDKPFFFNYFKWTKIFQTGRYEGKHPALITYPVGTLCLLLSLLQTVLLGAFFILRPLRGLEGVRFGREAAVAFPYFAALGIGFIAIEVVLMQRFVLFLGHPTYSMVTVLPTMLISAGLGSLTVGRNTDPARRLRQLLLWVPLSIGGSWLVTGLALDSLLGLSSALRFGIAIALCAPVGFVLGMAFPTGVRCIDREAPELIPWVWAVNSFTTVLGATGTVLVSMGVGFSAVMLSTIPLYLVGIAIFLRRFGTA